MIIRNTFDIKHEFNVDDLGVHVHTDGSCLIMDHPQEPIDGLSEDSTRTLYLVCVMADANNGTLPVFVNIATVSKALAIGDMESPIVELFDRGYLCHADADDAGTVVSDVPYIPAAMAADTEIGLIPTAAALGFYSRCTDGETIASLTSH